LFALPFHAGLSGVTGNSWRRVYAG